MKLRGNNPPPRSLLSSTTQALLEKEDYDNEGSRYNEGSRFDALEEDGVDEINNADDINHGSSAADLSPILAQISAEDAQTLVEDCGFIDDYQLIAKFLLETKHDNPFLSGMRKELQVICAFDQDSITADQELSETRSYRDATRVACLQKGYTYNGGHLAVLGTLDGVVAIAHYSPQSAANNVGEDDCHRIPLNGPGSECPMLMTVTFVKSCLFEQALEQNSDAVWPKETSQEVREKGKKIVICDSFPACLDKGDRTAKDLKKAKDDFVKALGFKDVTIDGKRIKAIRFAEMMGLITAIRNLVAMSKHTGKPVPTLAFGEVAKSALVNEGKIRSKFVEGCGASHHPEGIILARSRKKENIKESDTNMGKFYGYLLNGGKQMTMTFGMRRFERRYAKGEYLDIDVLKSEAARYMHEQVNIYKRTKEDVLDGMSFELSEHHYVIYYACVRGGETTGGMRTDAAWFVVEQMYIHGKTREEALDLMETELSVDHRAIYEGCILGGQRVGKKRTEAKEFMTQMMEQNVEAEEAYKLMEKQLSKSHVSLHRGSVLVGKKRTEAKEFMAKQREQNVEEEEAYQLMEKQLSKAHVSLHRGSVLVGQTKTEAKEFMAKQRALNVEDEEAYQLMEKQLSKAHVSLHRGSVLVGQTKTEAKEFMAKQRALNVEDEEAYQLMEKQLSKAHVSLHRGNVLGGENVGQMRTEAKEFMAKQRALNVEEEEAYQLMEKQLSKSHVSIHQGSVHERDANGKSLRSIKAHAKKDENGKSLKSLKSRATKIGKNPVYQQFVETTASQTKWQKSSKYSGDQKALACRYCMEANVEDKTKVWALIIPKDKSVNSGFLKRHILGRSGRKNGSASCLPCQFCPPDVIALISKGVQKKKG